jgi:muramidase (phage lysozyme)|tara:strand:+ start:4646 stop:5557 length:912 start_codon:yes stop_codon:yes gene_type:complete
VANISITGGTLVVEKERQEVVETIADVNENNVSVKRGTLVIKRIDEAVDVIQGGIQAMEQQQPASPNPDRPFYESTVPIEKRFVEPDQEATVSESSTDTAVEVQPSSKKGLLEFIGEGEGTYNSINRGTINGNIIGAEREGSRGGKKISELTISEIRNYQAIKDPNNPERLFTVGKYQTRPSTFEQAVKGLELSDDTVFSPEVQDSIGIYLIGQKREDLGKFLEGDESVSVDRAMFMLALEFASMPVPFDIKKGTYAEGTLPKVDLVAGDSFYKDPKAEQGNRALKTVEQTKEILLKTRDSSE